MSCLFCKIVSRQIPADIVFENEHVIGFRDIRPITPVHALVIPKVHLACIRDATREHATVLGEVMLAAREVAEKVGLGEKGYRLVVNNGEDGGQSVFHLHVHVLGGRAMAWPPG
jgi:histidine triad (HIT) family protein